MGTVRVAILRRLTGVLLLACTILGVASLHTLRHQDTGHAGAARVEAGPVQEPGVIAGAPCDADGCHWLASSGGHLPRHSSLWDVCLAVLTGSLVLILARSLVSATAFTVVPARRSRSPRLLPRPPPRQRLGLKITAVSALRI